MKFFRAWILFVAAAPFVWAQGSGVGPSSVQWENGVARLGTVRIDPKARTVSVTGWVNLAQGAIELLACGPAGKTHESVFVLDVNPLDLQTGLLLLGIKPGTPPSGLGQGRPKGSALEVWIEWTQDGALKKERAERFVFDSERGGALPKTPWIFTGSVIEDGEFKALAEESLIATYWDPWAIINIPLPCGSNDEILAVNTNRIPPIQTPITVRLKAR